MKFTVLQAAPTDTVVKTQEENVMNEWYLFLFSSSCRSGGEQYSQVDVRERRGLPSRL